MKKRGLLAAILFIGTVWSANWAVKHYGPVGVGFGLVAPAGVYFVGFAFTLRDVVHHTLGRWAVVAAIVAGALLSYLLSADAQLGGVVSLAVASGIAFLASETADLLVYAPLRSKGWAPAVLASNLVGLAVDSALFLWLAFGSLSFFWGQAIGKAWMTLVAVALIATARHVLRRPEAVPV